MNYPKELCRLVIRNMEIVEAAPAVAEIIEGKFFSAVNERIEAAVKDKKNWKGCYDLVTDNDDEETSFAPGSWPEDNDGNYGAYYTLSCTLGEECPNISWLSCAIGLNGAELCFAFGLNHRQWCISALEYRRSLEKFYSGNAALQESGFALAPGKKSLIRAFHFEADKLTAEYPDFDESLAPLDQALEDVFKAHGEFDNFVNKLKQWR